MAIGRIIIGGLILAFGALAWLGTLYENTPTPANPPPPIPRIFDFDLLLELAIDGVITAIGAVILAWGIRSSQSSRN